MAFEPIQPRHPRGAAHGVPKISVSVAKNGRTQITFSGALRDWLAPTPQKSDDIQLLRSFLWS